MIGLPLYRILHSSPSVRTHPLLLALVTEMVQESGGVMGPSFRMLPPPPDVDTIRARPSPASRRPVTSAAVLVSALGGLRVGLVGAAGLRAIGGRAAYPICPSKATHPWRRRPSGT